ncbi:deoxyribonuclease V [Planosporangium sp. 12N6]|uniref:deoxyribonuclease V n=1 Tax=Planosporangium spinosum TaxID=3402278 RepID=UPI003CFA064C
MDRWPMTAAEAEAVQDRLRPRVRPGGEPLRPRTVAGLDVSYATGSDRLAAAVVVLDADTLEVVEASVVDGTAAFDYVPGLLAFREIPSLLTALDRLAVTPDVLVCDGYGVAHPRRFGLACHLGVLTDLPAIGVAKTPFTWAYEPPGQRRGDWSPLVGDGEELGRVLRTRDGVRPVFVSTGHRVTLGSACDLVLRLCPRYRLPETTRLADRLSRHRLARVPAG